MPNDEIPSGWRAILEREFAADEGSFILQLRGQRKWDREAHSRLFLAMRECCKAHDGATHLERWIADGFHFFSSYMTQHYATSDDDYKANAAVNFEHLAHWLFNGEDRADDEFEPMDFD